MVEAFRPVQQAEIQRHTEGELPEAKIFDLLSSVGNGEHHALDLIVMREGVIYSMKALDKEMINRQGENPAWRMGWGVPFSHCRQSLAPIGLVTREAFSPDNTAWGYQITEYGLRTGVPFAGLLLKWSYEHPEHSLYKMLSSTNSTSIKDQQVLDKKRAQETRYKIFWEIVTNSSNRMRLTDLADAVNEDYRLTKNHLVSLSKSGIITYEAIRPGQSFSYFRLKDTVSDKEPGPYGKHRILATRLYNFLTQHSIQAPNEYLSVDEITNALIQEYPEYKNLNKKSLSSRAVNTLTDFEKQGHTERERFRADYHSEIILSDEQREVIVSFVTPLDNFKNGDRETIEEGRRFAQRVLNDPRPFSELMLKAKEASPFANRISREEMDGWIISTLHENPNITIKQIQQYLQSDYDKRLGFSPINSYLLRLARDEKIVSEKTKAGNEYRVVDNSDNQAV